MWWALLRRTRTTDGLMEIKPIGVFPAKSLPVALVVITTIVAINNVGCKVMSCKVCKRVAAARAEKNVACGAAVREGHPPRRASNRAVRRRGR